MIVSLLQKIKFANTKKKLSSILFISATLSHFILTTMLRQEINEEVRRLETAIENMALKRDILCGVNSIAKPARSKHSWTASTIVQQTNFVDWSSLGALASKLQRPKSTSGVVIKEIRDPDHPCHRQMGVFTTRAYPKKGSFKILYAGKAIISDKDSADKSRYCMQMDLKLPDPDMVVLIDADKQGNESRFINDYRNVKDSPNVVFKTTFDSSTGLPIVVGTNIRPLVLGEELLIDYGENFWRE